MLNFNYHFVLFVVFLLVIYSLSGKMEVASDIRGWDELIPDTLALIFTKLSLRERLTMIPMVCKSWASAVYGPYCWQEIEITDWSTAFTSIGKMSGWFRC